MPNPLLYSSIAVLRTSCSGILVTIALLLSLFPVSCSRNVENDADDDHYFDLEEYFDKEIDYLNAENPTVKKGVLLNDEKEHLDLKIDNWKKELRAFANSDINKPALVGKYDADTTMINGHLSKIVYIAKEEGLTTRRLEIQYDPNGTYADVIAIELSTSNILYNSKQELIYRHHKGYEISGQQSVRFLDTDLFSVEATFVF